VEGPRDTVSFVGDTVVLRCRTNNSQSSMIWTRGGSALTIASSARGVYSEYTRLSLNDSTDGQFDLLINSTQPDDADTYSCIVGLQLIMTADLTLLGTFSCCAIASLLISNLIICHIAIA